MALFGAVACLIAVCGCSHVAQAFVLSQAFVISREDSNTTKKRERVCISIAAYESPAWVDLLLTNALAFSEKHTKVVLHLDKHNEFSDEDLKRWETDRTTVTPTRIGVMPFEGSILYAHLLNAETMRRKWGNECKFFVLQASNMMWVRSGMEKQVRARRNSPLMPVKRGRGCGHSGNTYAKFTEELGAPTDRDGWGQPEGSFFPLDDVLDMQSMMKKFLEENNHNDGSMIYDAKCYFENAWLQTYMLNYAKLGDEETYNAKGLTPLCKNSISYGDKENDSIPLETMQKVLEGKGDYQGYFAVKRVNRKIEHGTTMEIAKMSGFNVAQNLFRYRPAVQ